MGTSVGAAFISIIIAFVLYVSKKQVPVAEGEEQGIHKLIYNKYYIDEIYAALVTKPLDKISQFLYNVVELLGIDGIVNGTGKLTVFTSGVLRKAQSGNTSFYIFAMVIGIVLIIGFSLIFNITI